jgi:glucosamine-6-phosphate deaminase
MINRMGISCKHLITFNMDEYANEKGETAPADWEGSFATSMHQSFFEKIDPKLRPVDKNIHFPTHRNIEDYWKMIEDAGGADCCYGGIGWCGHIAFWESHLGLEFGDDLKSYKQAHGRIVELNPMTIMQNALHTFSSDWSWCPPKAASIGPREILGARDRSFWLDGDCGSAAMSWQRFIARLVAHGPVNTLVPGSILQETNCGYHILGSVADDVKIDFS